MMDDKTAMPFGKYKGTRLVDVPADYLLWIYDNLNLKPDLIDYINDNRESLEAEAKKKREKY